MRFLIDLSCASLLGLGWLCALFRSFQLDREKKRAQHWYDESRVQSTMIRGLQHMLRSAPSPAEQRRTARKFRLAQDLRILTPIARRLARKAGRSGITVENVQRWAENHGVLLAYTDRAYRALVFGALMREAGLKPTGQLVRSSRIGTKGGNWNHKWTVAA